MVRGTKDLLPYPRSIENMQAPKKANSCNWSYRMQNVVRGVLLTMLLGCGAQAQTETGLFVSAEFQNRLYVPAPSSTLGATVLQTQSVALFSGNVGPPGSPNTPNDGSLWLIGSAIGQSAATAPTPGLTDCLGEGPYFSWLSQFFSAGSDAFPGQPSPLSGFHDDPDGDGRDNLWEYAMHGNPYVADAPLGIRLEALDVDGTNFMVASFYQRINDPNLNVGLEVSDDLIHWTAGPESLLLEAVESVDGEFTRVRYRDPAPLVGSTARFFKLEVAYQSDSPPVLSLRSPAPNAVVAQSAGIHFSGFAYDPDGCVLRVEFYADGVLIGSTAGGAFDFSWNPPALGQYTITARAVDNQGNIVLASARRVLADHDTDGDLIPDSLDPRPTIPNVPPNILLTTCRSTANFHSGGVVTIAVQTSDADGDLMFYQVLERGVILRSWQSPPEVNLTPAMAGVGEHLYAVQAKDAWGATAQRSCTAYVFRSPPRPQ
jgi:hypothetical protein